MAKRTSSRQFVTVFVSLILSFGVNAADLTVGYQTGIDPSISWSTGGKIQLNEEVTVTLTLRTNIGLFGDFGSFPITLRAQASGKSEVYWK